MQTHSKEIGRNYPASELSTMLTSTSQDGLHMKNDTCFGITSSLSQAGCRTRRTLPGSTHGLQGRRPPCRPIAERSLCETSRDCTHEAMRTRARHALVSSHAQRFYCKVSHFPSYTGAQSWCHVDLHNPHDLAISALMLGFHVLMNHALGSQLHEPVTTNMAHTPSRRPHHLNPVRKIQWLKRKPECLLKNPFTYISGHTCLGQACGALDWASSF